MKKISITLFLLVLFWTQLAAAGAGHSHGVANKQEQVSIAEIRKRASQTVISLADAGVIDKSWIGLEENKVEQKLFQQRAEWVVSYYNTRLNDLSKQNLYLFFNLYGEYVAANYSGE